MAGDDKFLTVTTNDVSGGINSRVNDALLPETNAETLTNVDIGEPGRRKKIPGTSIIATITASVPCVHLHNYVIQGTTDQLVLYEGYSARTWAGSGQFSAAVSAIFSAPVTIVGMVNGKKSGVSPDDICLISNGTDNVFELDSAGNIVDCGNTNTSPPLTPVMAWYQNRFWALKNDLAYYADAAAATTPLAWDRSTSAYRIPVGEERAIVPTRDSGMVFFGSDAIWALSPSPTPAVTDKPEPIIPNIGCVANNTAKAMGDDIYWLALDGVRSLKRNIQDKQQLGISYPISYRLKNEFSLISWAYIQKACAVVFDNKYFLALPINGSTYNNSVWVYYPATDGWTTIDGWKVGTWSTYVLNGQERLYYGDATTGIVYRAWTGTSNAGSNITYTEVSKGYNMGLPFQWKFGGNLEMRAEGSGGLANIYYSMDDSGWILLGTFNTLGGSGITFPLSFPLAFGEVGIVSDNYHLDKTGTRWKKIQFKITESSTDTLSILDNTILTHVDEYEEELP